MNNFAGLDKGECSPSDLENIKTLVPESLWPYVDSELINLLK